METKTGGAEKVYKVGMEHGDWRRVLRALSTELRAGSLEQDLFKYPFHFNYKAYLKADIFLLILWVKGIFKGQKVSDTLLCHFAFPYYFQTLEVTIFIKVNIPVFQNNSASGRCFCEVGYV